MNKSILLSLITAVALTTQAAQASPKTEVTPNKITVQTNQGLVEIENGKVIIHNLNSMPVNRVSQSSSSSSYSSSSQSSITTSSSTISLNRATSQQSQILKLEAPVKVTGKVLLNGKVIKEINAASSTIDLTSSLTSGTHELKVEVSAPGNETIKMQFSAPNTSVQNSSNGKIHHTYNLVVR